MQSGVKTETDELREAVEKIHSACKGTIGTINNFNSTFHKIYSNPWNITPAVYRNAKERWIDSIILTVADYHDTISTIKIMYPDRDVTAKVKEDRLVIKLSYKNGEKRYVYIPNGRVGLNVNRCLGLLPAICVESTSKKWFKKSSNSLAPEFWDVNWEEEATTPKSYDDVIDPLNLSNIEKHIFPLATAERPLSIFDVGGGKGRIAEKIIRLAAEKNIAIDYILIEPSAAQSQIARERFEKLKAENFKLGLSTVLTLTFERFSSSSIYAHYERTADCILSSGGPLNLDVGQFSQAQHILQQMKKFLRQGGCIIANGYTESLVTSKDFTANGLTLFSTCHRSVNQANEFNIRQNYVACLSNKRKRSFESGV